MSSQSRKQQQMDELIREFRINGNQEDAFDNLAAERLGVNRTDMHCLNIVENGGGLSAGELAVEAGLTTGAVTAVIDRLERAGYARRVADPADRRKVNVEVTPEFYARAGEIWGPLKADWEAAMRNRWTADQLAAINDFLRTTNEIGRRHMERVAELNSRAS